MALEVPTLRVRLGKVERAGEESVSRVTLLEDSCIYVSKGILFYTEDYLIYRVLHARTVSELDLFMSPSFGIQVGMRILSYDSLRFVLK